MNINITLTDNQIESVKQSVFSVLLPKDLAGELLTKIGMLRDHTDTSDKLYVALINYLKEQKELNNNEM